MATLKDRLKWNLVPFIKYCLIGVLVTLIDLGVVFLLKEYTQTALLWAVFFGFVLANSTSFVLNKYWTFRNYSISILRQWIKFVIVSFVGLTLTLFFMWLLATELALFKNITRYYYLICKGITSLIVVIWNFLSNKLWTFSETVRLNPKFEFARRYPYSLSVIVPAYNEEQRITPTLRRIFDYLQTQGIHAEVLVIDDGSVDDTSNKCKAGFGSEKNFRLIRLPGNQGKGFAVRIGIQNADGEYILFADADNSTPIEEFEKFRPHLSRQNILIGSRYLQPELVQEKQPRHRVFISRLANVLIQLFVVEGVKDTQCGFKVFHNEIGKKLTRMQRIKRFAFDIELLSLAQQSGLVIKEIPVRWINSADSRIRPIKDSVRTFYDLIKIKMFIWGRVYAKQLNV